MANNKSIQILRGSTNYDPSNINQELLDGQPFYSKKNRQLYIGDTAKKDTEGNLISSPVGAANLIPGEGLDSIVQIYSGGVDAKHFGNKDYVLDNSGEPLKGDDGNIKYGESAAIFGEANSNNENRTLMAGKMNRSTSANAFIVGLGNGRGISATPSLEPISGNNIILCGGQNQNIGAESALGFGNVNTNTGKCSLFGGTYVINSGAHAIAVAYGTQTRSAENHAVAAWLGGDRCYIGPNGVCSFVHGYRLESNYAGQKIFGKFNKNKSNTIMEIGQGSEEAPKNVFEVLTDGRAKVATAPIDNDDITRKIDIQDGSLLNIINGEGIDSVMQTYSGKVNATHYGNKDYIPDEEGEPVKDKDGNALYGESAAIFGEANSNNANRALLCGKMNINSGANALLAGYNNKNTAHHSTVLGSSNENHAIVSLISGEWNYNAGARSIVNGQYLTNRGSCSFMSGYGSPASKGKRSVIGAGSTACWLGGDGSTINTSNDGKDLIDNIVNCSFVFGAGLKSNYSNQVIFGRYNANKENTLFEIGNGEDGPEANPDINRANVFEVTRDGDFTLKGTANIGGKLHVEGAVTSVIDYDLEVKNILKASIGDVDSLYVSPNASDEGATLIVENNSTIITSGGLQIKAGNLNAPSLTIGSAGEFLINSDKLETKKRINAKLFSTVSDVFPNENGGGLDTNYINMININTGERTAKIDGASGQIDCDYLVTKNGLTAPSDGTHNEQIKLKMEFGNELNIYKAPHHEGTGRNICFLNWRGECQGLILKAGTGANDNNFGYFHCGPLDCGELSCSRITINGKTLTIY